MKVMYIFAVILLGGALTYLLLRFMPDRPVGSRTSDTVLATARIVENYDALDEKDAEILARDLRGMTNSSEINHRVSSFLLSKGEIPHPIRSYVSSNGYLTDFWGKPFILVMTNDTILNNLNVSLKRGNRPFVMWSSGPNQTNEMGGGDDVFSEK